MKYLTVRISCVILCILFIIASFGCEKKTIIKTKDGATMILIPAGWFEMGSDDYDKNYWGDDDEKPVHRVYVDAFYMDSYEVTNGQYKKFCDATERSYPSEPKFGRTRIEKYFRTYPQCPVVNVSWNDAVAYARWAGKRLPTEAEWEKSARGGLEGKKYPSGDSISHHDANYGQGYLWSVPGRIGGFPPNGYGLYDMAGNVWEWCSDLYDENYYGRSPERNPKGPSSGASRVYRGGSWRHVAYWARCASRGKLWPGDTWNCLGFRCARSP